MYSIFQRVGSVAAGIRTPSLLGRVKERSGKERLQELDTLILVPRIVYKENFPHLI